MLSSIHHASMRGRAAGRLQNKCSFRHSSRKRPFKLSTRRRQHPPLHLGHAILSAGTGCTHTLVPPPVVDHFSLREAVQMQIGGIELGRIVETLPIMDDQLATLDCNEVVVTQGFQHSTDMHRREARCVSEIRLPQRHRAPQIGGETDCLLPQVQLAEQVRDPAVGQAAPHRRDPGPEDPGIDQRLAPEQGSHVGESRRQPPQVLVRNEGEGARRQGPYTMIKGA